MYPNPNIWNTEFDERLSNTINKRTPSPGDALRLCRSMCVWRLWPVWRDMFVMALLHQLVVEHRSNIALGLYEVRSWFANGSLNDVLLEIDPDQLYITPGHCNIHLHLYILIVQTRTLEYMQSQQTHASTVSTLRPICCFPFLLIRRCFKLQSQLQKATKWVRVRGVGVQQSPMSRSVWTPYPVSICRANI